MTYLVCVSCSVRLICEKNELCQDELLHFFSVEFTQYTTNFFSIVFKKDLFFTYVTLVVGVEFFLI
jgi:hypothetical protein